MAGDEYYARAHGEFREMGLEGAALQVLREGLAAHPGSALLRALLAGDGPPEEAPGPAAPLAAAKLPAEPPAEPPVEPPAEPPAEPPTELPSELPAERFWSELRAQGLGPLLRRCGGCVRVLDVFAADVAERALGALEGLEASRWIESSSQVYDSKDSARHSFYRYDGDEIGEIKRALGLLDPALFPSFQAGRYQGSGQLEAHDDSHYFHIDQWDPNRSPRFPAGKVMFRKIAIIYYLSRDWREEYGGSLMDLHHEARPRRLVPRFNSLVAFLVPRVHEVERLAPGCPARLSVFGWLSDDAPYPLARQMGPEHSCMQLRAARAA